jgi:hypothetical protein
MSYDEVDEYFHRNWDSNTWEKVSIDGDSLLSICFRSILSALHCLDDLPGKHPFWNSKNKNPIGIKKNAWRNSR